MTTYYVRKTVSHNGKRYSRGETVDIEGSAEQMLAAGVIQEGPVEATSPEKNEDKPENEPTVGGDKNELGEPSIDGRDDGERTEATDVTVEVTEDMKRDELEAIAIKEGVTEAAISDAPNKAALVDLIKEKRAATDPATTNDPSAGL